jgi:partner of Y14 and mago protein
MMSEQKVLGGSMRPDGTMRKERKVRPGYVPQDEQPVYQSVGRQASDECPRIAPMQASAALAT